MTAPTYRHNCRMCLYLGQVSANGFRMDVYRCCGSGVVLRWGAEGFQYYAAQVEHFRRKGGIDKIRFHEGKRLEPDDKDLMVAWGEAQKWWE